MEISSISSDVGEAKENQISHANFGKRNGKSTNRSLIRSNIYGWLAHSELTSVNKSSTKKMRPHRISKSKVHLDDVDEGSINFNKQSEDRDASTSDIKFLDTISATTTTSMPEVSRTNNRSSISTIINGYASNKAAKGTPAIDSQLVMHQKPYISIISNPSHDPNMPNASNASTSNVNNNSSSIPQSSSNNQETAKKPKKRNGTSLSLSLRRLITTITFNRNHAATTSADPSDINTDCNSGSSIQSDAKVPSNYNTKSTLKNRDKKSARKQVPNNKRQSQPTVFTAKVTATPASTPTTNSSKSESGINNFDGVIVTQQSRDGANASQAHRRYSQFKESSSIALDDINIATRRKTISDSESLKGKVLVLEIPPWKPPENADVAEIDGKTYIECPLCVLLITESSATQLEGCRHRVCLECMQRYITTEINHSRLNITCPICSEPIHPNAIKQILQNDKYYLKYESFMLRRVLAAEPDARWCPAPDCSYVVLASGCASCPKLVCGREGCNTSFCYHCKQEWHPNQTCSAAGIQRNKRLVNSYNIIEETSQQSSTYRKSSKSSQKGTIRADDIKECPVCTSRIIKMNDGSCNHMTCSICETEFCWLCMKEISDLHYFSPSGCTFWGKKPWSRKKKILWQLGMLAGAPICILLIAGIAYPAIVIGIPVWVARKLHNRLERKRFNRFRKNAIITGGVLLSFLVSPLISTVALAIGIPFLLGYVYGVVPLSLCRSSGGCLSSTNSFEDLQREYQIAKNRNMLARDGISIDTATSHKLGDPSIGETSLYMSNASLETNSIGRVTTVDRDDRESASNAALAGSILSNTVDDGNSTRALAGSIMSKESGYTLIPAEVHNSNQVSDTHSAKSNTANPIDAASYQGRPKSENKLKVSCG